MISAWNRWRISTAIDHQEPLSPRLARAVRRDPDLRRFYEASLALAARLRRDALEVVRHEQDVGWVERSEPHQDACTIPRRTSFPTRPALPDELENSSHKHHPRRLMRYITAAALATCVALCGVLLWYEMSKARSSAAAQRADIAELADLIQQVKGGVDRTVERSAPKLQQLIVRSRDAVQAPMVREAKNVETDARNLFRAFSSMFSPETPRQHPTPDPKNPPSPSSSSGADVPASLPRLPA
jgi:hypothetical protein